MTSSLAAVRSSAFIFLKLPGEIGNRIYGYIFPHDNTALLRDYCETKTSAYVRIFQYEDSRNWIPPRVLQVNHQIREEALPLISEGNGVPSQFSGFCAFPWTTSEELSFPMLRFSQSRTDTLGPYPVT